MTDGYRFALHGGFLSEDTAKEASTYCDKLLNSTDHCWTTNFGWLAGKPREYADPERERYNNLVLVHQIVKTNRPLYDKIVADIKRHYPDLEPETENSVQYFVWTGGSNIEWHCDFTKHVEKKRNGAITIYLNRNWDIEWGGDFLYKDSNRKVQRVTPDYNLAVAIGKVDHRSTAVVGRHFRKCIQIFVKQSENSVDMNEDFC